MALDAGIMSVCIEFAKGLKDGDWFGRQDPYVVIRCGGQTFRTRTHVDGGKNPVWNETFRFNCINENTVDLEVKDEDVGKDDHIGTASFTLAKARMAGSDRLQVPVLSKKSRKQHGFISVSLTWQPNSALKPAAAHAQPTAYAHAPPAYAPAPGYYAPAPMPMYAAPAPAYYAPPPAGYPPMAAYPAPYPSAPFPPAAYAQPVRQ